MVEKKDVEVVGNLELHKKQGFLVASVNPKIYPLNMVYSAAYVFLDKAFVIIDGDPKDEILVELRPKQNGVNLEEMGREFNNELLSYAVYEVQSQKNAQIREAIVRRALMVEDVAKEQKSDVKKDEKNKC